MRQIGVESVLRAELGGKWLEQADRDLDLDAARPADEVAVAMRVGQMPAGDANLEVRVRHVAEAFERLEVALHGRRIDLGMLLPDARRDLLGRGVVPRAFERVEHQAALHGHPLAALADLLIDVQLLQVCGDSELCARCRYCGCLR